MTTPRLQPSGRDQGGAGWDQGSNNEGGRMSAGGCCGAQPNCSNRRGQKCACRLVVEAEIAAEACETGPRSDEQPAVVSVSQFDSEGVRSNSDASERGMA